MRSSPGLPEGEARRSIHQALATDLSIGRTRQALGLTHSNDPPCYIPRVRDASNMGSDITLLITDRQVVIVAFKHKKQQLV